MYMLCFESASGAIGQHRILTRIRKERSMVHIESADTMRNKAIDSPCVD